MPEDLVKMINEQLEAQEKAEEAANPKPQEEEEKHPAK